MTMRESGAGAGRIVILNRHLPHYRVPFFNALDERLAVSGQKLEVVYGTRDAELSGNYPWAIQRLNKAVRLRGREVLWQPAMPFIRHADLVIVEQASRLILNYYLALKQRFGWNKLAFWGHGKNFQANDAHAAAEWIKRRMSVNARWWFAYNGLTKSIVEKLGFPAERITVVQNAIDTTQLQELATGVSESEREALRDRLGLTGENVGIFCGSMYGDKLLNFLIDAAKLVRQRVPDFELLLVGSGPDQHLAEEAAARHTWVKYMGPKYGREKVELLTLSKVFLMPGAVGLAILDAFALGVPLVTTAAENHGPEIDYLHTGHNGIMTVKAVQPYADAIAGLMERPDQLDLLERNALAASRIYTVENMADNFHIGILTALNTESVQRVS